MPTLQTEYITILGTFERLFSQRIWKHAKILLIGAILSPAERTVTAALGRAREGSAKCLSYIVAGKATGLVGTAYRVGR